MSEIPYGSRAPRPLDYVTGALAHLAVWLVRCLPLDAASALGGFLGRILGPLTGAHRTASRNLDLVMPELSPAEKRRILRGMWDNLGRTAFEFPHLDRFHIDGPDARLEVIGREHAVPVEGRPAPIFVSAHYGNWEVLCLVASQLGQPPAMVYRAANNPIAERLLRRLRAPVGGRMLPKGPRSVRELIQATMAGEALALLVDQKLNDGVDVPFFGRMARTAPMPAEFTLRFGRPMVPAFAERLDGARFRVTILPPLEASGSARDPQAVQDLLTRMNALIESRIRARPELWFWVHRRWPES